MSTDLANHLKGTRHRLVPHEMRGPLREAEQLARYSWAAQFAGGRRVLDVGCGIGYGARLLAQGGASGVTGVDIAADVVEVARTAAGGNVTFDVADVRALPHADDSFDLVTCFEVFEHVEDRQAAMAELARVLAQGGVLVASSSSWHGDASVTPHHLESLTLTGFEDLLRERWPEVRLVQQHNFLASAIVPPESHDDTEAPLSPAVDVRALAPKDAGEEICTLALCSDSVQAAAALVALASPVEIRQLVDRIEEQHEAIHALHVQLDHEGRRMADRRDALARLAETEQAIAQLPGLKARVATLDDELNEVRARLRQATEQRDRADAVARSVTGSPSWRMTAPLRRLKGLLLRR